MSAYTAPLTSSSGVSLLRRPTRSARSARPRSSTTVRALITSPSSSTSATATDRVTLGTSELSVSATGVGAWAWGTVMQILLATSWLQCVLNPRLFS